jgi:hypothetical protein
LGLLGTVPPGFAPERTVAGRAEGVACASGEPAVEETEPVRAATCREACREGEASGRAVTTFTPDSGAGATSLGTDVGLPSPTTRPGSLTAATAAAPKAVATTMIVRILLTPSPGIADAL